MKIFLLILAIVEALIILGLLIALIISVSKKGTQTKLKKQADYIVKGKLDIEDVMAEGDSDSAVLARAFNSIKNNLMTFVETTKVNVVTLSDAIDALSKSVDANIEGNKQLADGASNVAQRTIEQLELVRDNLAVIDSNNERMQEINSAMDTIRNILDETVSVSDDGLKNLEGYEKEMVMMAADLNRINEILDKFNSEIKKIGEVGDFVVEISDQLRLLAFNASIEAARAGQAGKGFTVVADEMNVMSAKTREGMQEINRILKEVVESSKMVNQSISNCEHTYEKSKDTFSTVNSSFRLINSSASDINDKIGEISGMFDVMSDNLDKSKEQAQDLYETAQAISDSSHEMADVSEENAAESAKIGDNAEALNGMLAGIQNLLRQFNTAIVPTNKAPSKKVQILALSMLDNDFWYGVRKGVLYSQKELAGKNVTVEYVPLIPGELSLDDLLKQTIRSAIDRGFNGIVFPGFLGGANKEFKEAASKGIKLMAYNCDCNSEIKRVACLRPDTLEPGALAAKSCEKKLGGHGRVIMLIGDKTVSVNVERSQGFRSRISQAKGITIAAEMTIPDNADEVYRITKQALSSHPDAGVIFITNGFPLAAAKAIKESGKAGKVSLVCFDHNQEIFNYIKSGIICAAIGQDAFGQGHDPVIWLYNNIVAGDKLENYIPCRLTVVDKSNVDSLVEA